MLAWTLAAAGCGAEGPTRPSPDVIAALDVTVEVVPSSGIAGDTVDVVTTVFNPLDRPVSLSSSDECLVTSVRVERSGGVVPFLGAGERPCTEEGEVRIAGTDSLQVRVPLVLWQEPASDDALVDGPPWPQNHEVVVTSAPLNREVRDGFGVQPSGLHQKFGEICGPAPPGLHPMEIVLRHEVVAESLLRVRFEVHNRGGESFQVEICNGWVVSALDRRTEEGWQLGDRPVFCLARYGPVRLEPGGCVRGVRLDSGIVPGEYRLRLWTSRGVVTTETVSVD